MLYSGCSSHERMMPSANKLCWLIPAGTVGDLGLVCVNVIAKDRASSSSTGITQDVLFPTRVQLSPAEVSVALLLLHGTSSSAATAENGYADNYRTASTYGIYWPNAKLWIWRWMRGLSPHLIYKQSLTETFDGSIDGGHLTRVIPLDCSFVAECARE